MRIICNCFLCLTTKGLRFTYKQSCYTLSHCSCSWQSDHSFAFRASCSKYTTVHVNIGFGCNLAILIAKQVSLTHHLMRLNPFVRKPFYQAIKAPKSCLLPRNEDSTPFSQDLCSVHGQTFLSQVLSTWQLLSQDSMACALYILHMLCKQFGTLRYENN